MFLEIIVLVFFAILFMVIVSCFLFGPTVLGILLLMSIPIALAITKITQRRISPFLVINIRKKDKKIEQSISLKMFISLSLKNNYKNGNIAKNIYKEILNSKVDLIKYFTNSNFKILETTTNKIMYNQLMKIEKDTNIKIVKIEGTTKNKSQIMPKIILMGIKTNIINVFNRDYWGYILRAEEVSKYKIILLKNEV